MSNTLLFHKKIPLGIVFVFILAFCVWYFLFQWNAFDCYAPYRSPNGEYYITTHQTPWEKFWNTYPDEYGTARLYDKTGRLLHEGKTYFGYNGAGPYWVEWHGQNLKPDEVFFMSDPSGIDRNYYWQYKLPISPSK
jgi:hypothetical protein